MDDKDPGIEEDTKISLARNTQSKNHKETEVSHRTLKIYIMTYHLSQASVEKCPDQTDDIHPYQTDDICSDQANEICPVECEGNCPNNQTEDQKTVQTVVVIIESTPEKEVISNTLVPCLYYYKNFQAKFDETCSTADEIDN